MDVSEVAADLVAEQESLDQILSDASEEQWKMPTPSPRWTVSDQIGHLTYFDGTAAMAVTAPQMFQQTIAQLMTAAAGGDEGVEEFTLGSFRRMSPVELLGAWRSNRQVLIDAAATLGNDTRVPWYGPSMGAKSFLTARLMETWAHGQDVADTLGIGRPATDRLRHIAQLGYITRKWTYLNRGLEAPAGDVRVELVAPSGDAWTWGDADGASVVGDALDFCLVVTQRRNVADTNLRLEGNRAVDWMNKAQAFAGPPTDGPGLNREADR